MNWIEAVIIGILQGFTEFLPISSSGHIELARVLLRANVEEGLTLQIILHGATVISTIIVFRKEIYEIFKDVLSFKKSEASMMALKIGVSMIPLGIVGLFFEEEVSSLFTGRPFWIGLMLLFTGTLLFATAKMYGRDKKITFLVAILIGLFQALAIIPGISRSGATLAAALLLGVKRTDATQFSFLMILPPMLGATLLQVRDLSAQASAGGDEPAMLGIAFFFALVSGVFACKWMIEIVKKGNLYYFGAYCFLIGITAMVWSYWI